jgi:hypothetical protein
VEAVRAKVVASATAAAWNGVHKRTVIDITLSYLAGTDSKTYSAWRELLEPVLAQFDSIELHRETLMIRAFALVKWLRLIVNSAYVHIESQHGKFDDNFVPVFIGKLGEFLAALSKLRDESLDRPIHAALTAEYGLPSARMTRQCSLPRT